MCGWTWDRSGKFWYREDEWASLEDVKGKFQNTCKSIQSGDKHDIKLYKVWFKEEE